MTAKDCNFIKYKQKCNKYTFCTTETLHQCVKFITNYKYCH